MELEFKYCVQKNPPLVHILSQINPINIPTSLKLILTYPPKVSHTSQCPN
jgi:hypothetical protein